MGRGGQQKALLALVGSSKQAVRTGVGVGLGENAWERLGRIEIVFVCATAVSLATPSLKLFCSRGSPPPEETINSSFIVAANGHAFAKRYTFFSFRFVLKSKCCKQENKIITFKLKDTSAKGYKKGVQRCSRHSAFLC